MDNLPLEISVIVPAYQAENTVGRALKSVASQTRVPKEVIVVDDGSKDGTALVAEAMRNSMAGINLKVLRQDHQGAGAARNTAIREAQLEYVAFLDADDEWLPEKLERSMKVMSQTDSMLVSHDYIRREANGRETVIGDCSRNFSRCDEPYLELYRLGYIATSGVVVRREAVIAAGGFDETLQAAQDFALWLKMLSKPNVSFVVFPGALLRYNMTRGSISSYTERRLHCTLQIARQFFPTIVERSRFPLIILWYRIIAVHYEAVCAYVGQRRIGAALGVILRSPINLIIMTIFCRINQK